MIETSPVCAREGCGNKVVQSGRRTPHRRRYCSNACRNKAFRSHSTRPLEHATMDQGANPKGSIVAASWKAISPASRPFDVDRMVFGDYTIVADAKWPGMYRVRMPDGTLTDMVNRARARDMAGAWLETAQRATRTATEGRTEASAAFPETPLADVHAHHGAS